jgi:hypothetical protein
MARSFRERSAVSLQEWDTHSERGAHLVYDFSRGGRYIGAELQLPQSLPAAAVAFWIKSPPGIHVVLRVVDGTGQTLQYNPPRPLDAFDVTAWYRQVIDLAIPNDCWGGGDGVCMAISNAFPFWPPIPWNKEPWERLTLTR